MTSNERKILCCLWDAKGKTNIQCLASKTSLSNDYTRLLCSSLARAGYIKFNDINNCYLLTKGRNRFQNIEVVAASASFNPIDPVLDVEEITEEKAEAGTGEIQNKEEEIAKEQEQLKVLENLQDASPQEKEKLTQAGYKSTEDLAQAPIAKIMQGIGVNLKKAANWINQARRKTGAIGDQKAESKK